MKVYTGTSEKVEEGANLVLKTSLSTVSVSSSVVGASMSSKSCYFFETQFCSGELVLIVSHGHAEFHWY